MEYLWYNGNGQYELLDFDPKGLTKEQVIEKALKEFDRLGIYENDVDKALETLYLLETKHLTKLID